jgi:cell wall-associated NlpC family hydrolase
VNRKPQYPGTRPGCRFLAVTIVSVLAAFTILLTGTAHAATASPGQLLAAAETRTGDWYSYGSAGPTTFDCSGLVEWAAHEIGVNLPRDTFEMLDSSLLVPTSNPVAGDLAFYGTGHVEIVAPGHDVTFGALQAGTRIGFHQWNAYWHPTEYFAVR